MIDSPKRTSRIRTSGIPIVGITRKQGQISRPVFREISKRRAANFPRKRGRAHRSGNFEVIFQYFAVFVSVRERKQDDTADDVVVSMQGY